MRAEQRRAHYSLGKASADLALHAGCLSLGQYETELSRLAARWSQDELASLICCPCASAASTEAKTCPVKAA